MMGTSQGERALAKKMEIQVWQRMHQPGKIADCVNAGWIG